MANESSNSVKAALAWIETIEGIPGQIRGNDLYPFLRAWVDRVAPQRVLDLGCGQGMASAKIDLTNRTYCGVDPSATMIARAKSLYRDPSLTFVAGDASDIPLADSVVSAAFSLAVWHLLETPAAAARELGRVLKPGGHFLIATAHPDTYATWRNLYAEKSVEGRRCDGTLVLRDGSSVRETLFLDSAEEIVRDLATGGLRVTGQETIRHFLLLEGHKDGPG